MASSSQINLSQVRGSGPGGRIIRRDVEAYLAGAQAPAEGQSQAPAAPDAAPAPAVTAKPAPPPAERPAAPQPARPSFTPPPLAAQRIPHSRMRKTIAQRMTQAKQSAPEIHVTIEARVDKLVTVREELNRQLAPEKIKLSLGDFVTKAVASALRRHPGLNASFEPDAIVRHGEINLGIAVALDEGLIVPVLHRADTLGLAEIRRQSEALAAAARAGNLFELSSLPAARSPSATSACTECVNSTPS